MADFWDQTNPDLPVGGPKDPDARIPLYISWAEYMAQEGATYVSHEVFIEGVEASTVTDGLLLEDITFFAGLFTLWAVGGDEGERYRVTIRFHGAVGGEALIDDRSFIIKIGER